LLAGLSRLGEYAEAVAASRRGGAAGAAGAAEAPRCLKWSRALTVGLDSSRLRAWRAWASPTQRARQAVLGHGRWLLMEPPGNVRYSRTEGLVAVRMWHGLDVVPAIPDSDDCAVCCQNRYVVTNADGVRAVGETCKSRRGSRRCGNQTALAPTVLDRKGRHALVCKVGGVAVARHNYIRDVLGGALRPLVSGVRWERYLPDIVRADGAEKSRLDLVIRDPEHVGMLDVVVFHPLQRCVTKAYRHLDHERAKYDRLPLPTAPRRPAAARPAVDPCCGVDPWRLERRVLRVSLWH